jgi:anti-sigma regulatory factor (Ser/Thr protein kinase)
MSEAVHADESTHAHHALFYRDDDDYVQAVGDFIAPGLEAGEPVAVAVPPSRCGLLRERLGNDTEHVQMLDMLELGRNPARIIPAVHELLARHGGQLLHYVGEPIWPGRRAEEIREATRHEALINLAWPGAAIRVLCPYDATALDAEVLHAAELTHPWIIHGEGDGSLSRSYAGAAIPRAADLPLPEPPRTAARFAFGLDDLSTVRSIAGRHGTRSGLSQERTADLVLAVNEVATNAIKHAQARGLVRLWTTTNQVVCQLEDPGHIADPLAGTHMPTLSVDGGLGLWMVNQLCDLVEARTGALGTVIRLTMNLR